MPTLLSDLINAIPVAARGDVISPEHYNSMRDAIVAIVTELGGAAESRSVTLTFIPTFLEVLDPSTGGQLPKWTINIGLAQSFGGNPRVRGWLPLQLPDASRIQQLIVVFGGTGQLLPSAMRVQLQRQFISGGISPEKLATMSVGNVDLASVKIENAPFSGERGADTVNNDDYKYFVLADLDELPRTVNLTIFAIRVDCRLG